MRHDFAFPARIDRVAEYAAQVTIALGQPFARPLVHAAITEALLNGIGHGALGVERDPADERDFDSLEAPPQPATGDPRLVHVNVSVEGDEAAVSVSDFGDGFDWSEVLRANAEPDRTRGRGLQIISAAAKRVAWTHDGSAVTMVFGPNESRRESSRADQAEAPSPSAGSANLPPEDAASAGGLPPALGNARERWRARLSRINTLAWRDLLRSAGPLVRRAVDVGVGVVGLSLAGPVIAIGAVAVKATSSGPAFFGQDRAGQFGAPFRMFKIRSMYIDAAERLATLQHMNESKGAVTFKIRKDPRVTPVGRVLRKFSIDELPQLWNLVNGTMTLIGPRPLVLYETARLDARGRRRLEVKPGLTCLWQISGRSDLSFDQQVTLDLRYIDTSTPTDEARILANTIPAVVSGRGAY